MLGEASVDGGDGAPEDVVGSPKDREFLEGEHIEVVFDYTE